MYDASLGRFTTIDPHAENYFDLSPFAYVANNPMIFIDPTGMDIEYDKDASFWFKVKTTVQLAAGWVASGTMRNQLNTLMKSENTHTIHQIDGAGSRVISKELDAHNESKPAPPEIETNIDSDGNITMGIKDAAAHDAAMDKWQGEHAEITSHKDGTGVGTNIYIGDGKGMKDVLKDNGVNKKVLFGHELTHAVDNDKGRMNTDNMKPGVGSNAQQRYGTYSEHRAVRYQNAVTRDLNRFRPFNKLRIRNEY